VTLGISRPARKRRTKSLTLFKDLTGNIAFSRREPAPRRPCVTSQAHRFLRGAAATFPAPSAKSAGAAALDHLLFGPGESAVPAAGENAIRLSGCEGAAPSGRGRAAAERAYARLVSGAAPALPHWFADLRRRLAILFGAPGCDVILAASDAGSELIFDALARAALARPVVHLAAAAPERPNETGMEFAALALRDRYGLPRDAGLIDADAARLAEQAIASGKDVVLHVADCSETGLAGPSRAIAGALAAAWPGRICILIDARQMRCEPEQTALDLAAGFAVLMSGSTFAGGPSGASALLLPPALFERVDSFELPDAPAAASAAMDWPPRLRDRLVGDFATLADPGLGLRWECALAELEFYFAVGADLLAQVRAAFAHEIRCHLAAAPALKLTDCGWRAEDSRSLFPILTFDESGRALNPEPLRRALADPTARRGGWTSRGRPVHLGAPLRIGARNALRLSLSAPLVSDVVERIGEGCSFAAAFQPLADDLLEAFALWSDLASAERF
jgi:hypothetical protein